MKHEPGIITAALSRLRTGGQDAWEETVALVYTELKRIAAQQMRREEGCHLLQPTALVHEAWLRLVKQRHNWRNREHFFGVAAHLMRLVLVDCARAQKRERLKQEALALDTGVLGGGRREQDIEALDAALNKLAELDERQADIVELRYFGGLSIEETAEILKISPKTVKRDWAVARTWLHAELATERT